MLQKKCYVKKRKLLSALSLMFSTQLVLTTLVSKACFKEFNLMILLFCPNFANGKGETTTAFGVYKEME